ncbi:MAG: hypothetical protein ACREO1_13625 [Arenimonas sp.]
MDDSYQLEQIDGIVIFRPVGNMRFQQTVALISEAMVTARELGFKKVLIVCEELTGFQPPSLSERHWMIREWVAASEGSLKMALVAPAAFIDPEKFGVVAAANFGMTAEVFTSESEAMDWLQGLA